MNKVVASRPVVDFPRPETVVTCRIDPTTGLLAREECPQKLDEFFISGTESTDYCTAHGEVQAQPGDHPAGPVQIREQ